MNYYGYQQPYGGSPYMGGQYGQPIPPAQPYGQMGQMGYNQFQGAVPNYGGCMKCGGSGYRISRKGKTKKCKCIKEQEKRMGNYYGYSSSDSD